MIAQPWNTFCHLCNVMKQLLHIALIFSTFAAIPSADAHAQEGKPPLVSLDTLDQIPLRRINNQAFGDGEMLRYRLHYGIIDAGEAVITVKSAPRKIQNREVFQVVGKGRTLGAFNLFYKVNDHYETYLDKQGIFPWLFIRDVNEGGYKIKQNYSFYQDKRAVKTHKGEVFYVEPQVQDMLSAFYFARTLNFSEAQVGEVFTIPSFVDGEEWPLRIKFIGREVINTRTGKYRCLKFVPVVQKGRIFKAEEDLMVWITDDLNRIPVLAQAKVLVGSIKMELVEYNGIANPLAKVN